MRLCVCMRLLFLCVRFSVYVCLHACICSIQGLKRSRMLIMFSLTNEALCLLRDLSQSTSHWPLQIHYIMNRYWYIFKIETLNPHKSASVHHTPNLKIRSSTLHWYFLNQSRFHTPLYLRITKTGTKSSAKNLWLKRINLCITDGA